MFEILDMETLQTFVAFAFTTIVGMLALWLFVSNNNKRG